MFHRPASIGGDSNVMNASRQRNLLSSQNENVNLTSKATASDATTPAKSLSRPRRAFGDISNKKGANGSATGGCGKNQPSSSAKKSSVVLKPRSSNTGLNPGNISSNTTKKQFQSRIPKTVGSSKQPLSKRTHPWSTHAQQKDTSRSSSSGLKPRITSPAPSSSRQADFVLPSSNRHIEQLDTKEPEAAALAQVQAKPQREIPGPVDDVELPAGRLWVQQLEHDDPLGDDDVSTSSMGETLNRRTMWDDWRETMMRQWEEERRDRELADERELKAQLEKVLRADEHDVGLQSLFDSIDALHVNDSDDLDLDHLLEDDDWSAPASSIDGTLALTFDL